MVDVGRLYVNGLHDRFSYWAAWLPNTNLRLGDVGRLRGEYFTVEATLEELRVPFKVRKGAKRVDFDYTSQTGISVKAKAAGQVAAGTTLPQAQAGVSMQFSKKGAFLFQAAGCMVDEIEDKAALGKAVVKLLEERIWNPDWAVIDTLVRADCTTIVLSNSRSAGLDLTAKTAVTTANLANLNAGFEVNHQSGDVIHFVAEKGLAPLFKLSRLKESVTTRLARLLGMSGNFPRPGDFNRIAYLGSNRGETAEALHEESNETIEDFLKESPLETVAPKWE